MIKTGELNQNIRGKVEDNPFWLEIIIGTASGLAVALISWLVPRFFCGWSSRKNRNTESSPPKQDDHSIQIGSAGRDVYAQTVDRRQFHEHTVNEYINHDHQNNINRNSSESSEEIWGRFAVMLIALFLSAIVFVLYAPVFWAVTIGVSLGLLVGIISVYVRTKKLIVERVQSGTLTILAAAFVLAGAVVTWLLINVSTVEGYTLREIRVAITAPLAGREAGIVEQFLFAFSAISENLGFAGWYFLSFQLLASIIVVFMLIVLIMRVIDWNTYLQFARRTTTDVRIIKRAARFRDKGWGMLFSSIFGSAIAAFLASGYAAQWLDSIRDINSNINM
ncbi:hypothetical protein [Kocuria flava]|uniref:hypothetical protein n=1 Tax=Kocuria flava TaxID=446860 RepID=UPI0015DE3FE7|nr:hypothetical protein [Kocuria flava]